MKGNFFKSYTIPDECRLTGFFEKNLNWIILNGKED